MIVVFEFDIILASTSIEDAQSYLASILIRAGKSTYSRNAFDNLTFDHGLLIKARAEKENIDANAAGRERPLNPAYEVAVESVEDDNLYVGHISWLATRQR